ncbi:class I SAM-dependent DNA methyltransferase [Roseiarcaceae bacterium H3SJ34-1]|uniref:class I SAM-dependent DNA methyltransferase n=1 Tax=Terripilifer ovatus TaxID=3032367 RepID=UPI003AB96FCB|nr:class I SAM-dependent DNA methyltransferase [Roseiarcaceae bacterium H3SJ34-1]
MTIETFLARWTGREGGQERANYALFLSELCDTLEVPRPDPAGSTTETNDYVFERAVREAGRDGGASNKRIDLYRRDAFILEAKQSRQKGGTKELEGQGTLFETEPEKRGTRAASKAWDSLMMNARTQAEGYVRLLPESHVAPPFIIACDVGHCFEIYANFRRDGKAYDQFPDRQGFRIYLEDLRKPEVRQRLRAIWLDPENLDPSRVSARVTRDIAERLARVSRTLEAKKYKADRVAMFLMRCLFTMFAEDVGLLPEKSFKQVLEACEKDPSTFPHDVGQLWEAMDKGGYAHAIRKTVKRFNGEFFKTSEVLPLEKDAISELRNAAAHNWREVEPAIFGTLVEQALDPKERKSLGAHYTPRPYVERLVLATLIDPLRAQWNRVIATVEGHRAARRDKEAIAAVRVFHDELTRLRILDPACGTGNFLYVSLELMKRLEGEVLEVLVDLGGQEALTGLGGHTVDPHQFLGLEVNPRAAAIAELVLWIGYLQWFFRTAKGEPPEPILRAFHNIIERDAVLTPDRKKRPEWPEAEFIVGNPPFIGGKDIRARLGTEYAQALWAVHKHMNESADFVMYWWDRAAELLTRKGTRLRRFGLVTTNSISQVLQRRVMERHLNAKKPISLVFAVADHPWTKATKDAAAVRIAMTVGEAGKSDGVLLEVTHESGLESDMPAIGLLEKVGRINSDLTIGVDITTAVPLKANEAICSPGVKLHGSGFIITPEQASVLGLGSVPGIEKHIRLYRNGRDLTSRPRDVMVIDLFGLDADDVRSEFPSLYQHVLTHVKSERQKVFSKSGTKDAQSYLDNWWIFGKPRIELRPALAALPRYIVTVETTKHRVFQFLDESILPDNMLVAIASDDAFHLGILSSRLHVVWALRAGGWLGVGNDPRYSKSRCFDPFPFPVATDAQKATIRVVAEELDAHRKGVLAKHSHLTLTGLYNVLERVKAGAPVSGEIAAIPDPDSRRTPATEDGPARELTADEWRTFNDGLVMILKELHERLDTAVADAYGWPVDLSSDEILVRLVTLNKERAKEEARGMVRWLRSDYQIPRFGSIKEKAELELSGEADGQIVAAGPKPSFPENDVEQTAAIMATLAVASSPLNAADVALRFKQGRRIERKVSESLEAIARMGFARRDGGRFFIQRAA